MMYADVLETVRREAERRAEAHDSVTASRAHPDYATERDMHSAYAEAYRNVVKWIDKGVKEIHDRIVQV